MLKTMGTCTQVSEHLAAQAITTAVNT